MMHLGQDIGAYGGTFGVTRGSTSDSATTSIRDGPLCESATVGFAIGLAISGVRAIVRDRVLRLRRRRDGSDRQPGGQAALLHGWEALGAARHPNADRLAASGIGPQHSQSLEAWFMHIPGIKIAHAVERAGRLRAPAERVARPQSRAVHRERPALRSARGRRSRRRADTVRSARSCARAADVTVVALSNMVDEALVAADALAERGISIEVIDPRTIAPLDMETILDSLRKTVRARRLPRRAQDGRVRRRARRAVHGAGFDHLDAPVERVAGLDVPIPCGRRDGSASTRPPTPSSSRSRALLARDRADAPAALDLDGRGVSPGWSRRRRRDRRSASGRDRVGEATGQVEAGRVADRAPVGERCGRASSPRSTTAGSGSRSLAAHADAGSTALRRARSA